VEVRRWGGVGWRGGWVCGKVGGSRMCGFERVDDIAFIGLII